MMQQPATRRRLAHAPALAAAAALAVVLLAALLPGTADAAPAWLLPLLPHGGGGGGKPLVIEGVVCPAAVVDVPTSAAFPPAPWAASATYRLTTAGAEYVLPAGAVGGPLVIGVNVTVCVVGTRATLRSASRSGFFQLEGGALGLSGVTLRSSGDFPSGVRCPTGPPSTLGVADASFEQLTPAVSLLTKGSSAALRDTKFVRNSGISVFVGDGTTAVFRGDTLFANNTFYTLDANGATTVVFEGPARFLNNSDVRSAGVAVRAGGGCLVRFLSDTVFEDNFAIPFVSSGTITLQTGRLSFEGGKTRFARNNVGTSRNSIGAAVFAQLGASLLFASDTTEFVDQVAYNGAGVYLTRDSVANFTRGAVRATGCRVANGGVLAFLARNSTAVFGPDTTLDVVGNSGAYGAVAAFAGSRVDVQSRTARFVSNYASKNGSVAFIDSSSTLTFGPATSVTLADNVAGELGGAIVAFENATVAFEGGACIKNNSVQNSSGGGALHVGANSRIVFKDPPAAGGGGCGILPHPFLASKLCPAAPQQQVMGDNSPVAAVVGDSTSAIVCASNGLTRGQGSWAIEGPVCGQACVAGGGNCTCPAGQPFSAAECACKAPKPAWPFPHPWPFGTKASAASSSVPSGSNLG